MTSPEPATTQLLDVRDLAVAYGAVTAVRNVSLHVAPGEIVALLGANGAGKTSLLRAISGLEPSTGAVTFDGRSIGGRRPERIVEAGMSYVPEGRRVLGQLTVLDNLEIAGTPQRSRGRPRNSELATVFSLFPRLEQRLGQKAYSLSGGEQQMLAIGRALMAGPLLILLDEPSLGLAPFLVTEVFRTLADIRDAGVALVLVEQNANMALTLADRAYVLNQGRMVLSGPAAELRGDPRLRAAYLGGAPPSSPDLVTTPDELDSGR